jgi:hypothetical protein
MYSGIGAAVALVGEKSFLGAHESPGGSSAPAAG